MPDNPTTEETLYGNVEEVKEGVTQSGSDYANITIKADHLNWGMKIGVFATQVNPTLVQDALSLSVGSRVGVKFTKRPMPNGAGHFRNLVEFLGAEPSSNQIAKPIAFNSVATSPSQNQQTGGSVPPVIFGNTDQDRQNRIMLQNASSWIGGAYMNWLKLGEDRVPFQVILDEIAHYAKTYLDEVYLPIGLNSRLFEEPEALPTTDTSIEGNNDQELISEEEITEDNPF